MPLNNWIRPNSRMIKLAEQAWSQIQRHPTPVIYGAIAGAGLGIVTSNEGRGPIGNTMFWAPIGVGAGLAVAAGAPGAIKAWGEWSEVQSFLRKAPRDLRGPAAASSVAAWEAAVGARVGSNTALKSISRMYRAPMETPDWYLGRQNTAVEWTGQIQELIRGRMGISPDAPWGKAAFAGMDVPAWMGNAMEMSLATGEKGLTKSSGRFGPGAFSRNARSYDWDQVLDIIDTHGATPQHRAEFLGDLYGKIKSFYHSGMGFGTSADELGMTAARGKMAVEIQDEVELISRLKGQGQNKLAAQISRASKLNRGFRVEGLVQPHIHASEINALKIYLETGGILEVPVVHSTGFIHHGIFGRNAYVPRSIVDLAALKALSDGSLAKNVRPNLMDPASFVMKGLTDYWKPSDEASWMEFVGNARNPGQVLRAAIWEGNAFRPDRSGLLPNVLHRSLRKIQAQVLMPMDAAADLTKTIGLPQGEHALMNPRMGYMQGTMVSDWMAQHGMFQMGSETAGRNAIFEAASEVGAYDIGSLENPLAKANAFLRDFGKHYGLQAKGAAATAVTQPFFRSSRMEATVMRGEASFGYMQKVQGLFESELDFTRKMVYGGNEAQVNRLFQEAGIAKDQWTRLRGNLESVARVNEGIVAAAVPGGLQMTSHRAIELSHLGSDLIKGRSQADFMAAVKAGKVALGPNQWLGYDTWTGQPVGHTFSGRGRGYAVVRDVRTYFEPKTQQSRFVLDVEEVLPIQRAKVGTLAYKGFTEPIKGGGGDVIQLFNFLRQSKQHTSLYVNEAVVPLLSSGGSRDIVNTFAMFSSIEKYQNRTQILANNLFAKYFPQMTTTGRNRVIEILKNHSVDVMDMGAGRFEGIYKSALPGVMGNARTYQAQRQQLRTIRKGIFRAYREIYRDPAAMIQGRWQRRAAAAGMTGVAGWMGDRFAKGMPQIAGLSAREFYKTIQATEMATGIVTHAMPWDALNMNVPTRAGITMHELNILKSQGMGTIAQELAGRVKRMGDQGVTARFYEAMALAGSERPMTLTDAIAKQAGIGIKTLDEVGDISGINTTMNFANVKIHGNQWRRMAAYSDNFAVDLVTAQNTMTDAAVRVRKALGTTRIMVPGGASDLYQAEYTLATGRVINSTAFMEPVENLLENISKFYEVSADPHKSEMFLKKAVRAHKKYIGTMADMMKVPFSGRGGAARDIGPWTAGRLTFMDYRAQFSKILGSEEAAANVMGVSPAEWSSLRRSGAKTHMIGGHEFMTGISKRYPITSADPVLITLDKHLKEGMAMDEAYRFIKGADFDGDTMLAHILMDAGSIKQAHEALLTPGSAVFKNYAEMKRMSDIFGGMGEDITRRVASGAVYNRNIMEKFGERLKKFKLLDQQAVTERMAKAWTAHIGMYSNLSKVLQFMTVQEGMSTTEGYMRSMISNQLQQLSIDFGRRSGAFDIPDPSALAFDMRRAWMTAAGGNIAEGNQQMAGVFKQLGFGGMFAGEMRTAQKAYRAQGNMAAAGAVRQDVRMLRNLTRNWFSTVNEAGDMVDLSKTEMAKRAEYMDTMLKQGLRSEEYEEAMREWAINNRVLAAGGAEGMGVYPGVRTGAGMSQEFITQSNLWIKKGGAAAQHILEGAWTSFKGSPAARAAAIVGGSALALGAVMGALSSPTKFSAPDSPSSKAYMRSPDTAFVGATGEAPSPGSRGGQVPYRNGPEVVADPSRGVFMKDRRMYYDQTNRVPRVTSYEEDSPEAINNHVSYYSQSMGPGGSSVNVINSPGARRMSKHEMEYKLRDQLS